MDANGPWQLFHATAGSAWRRSRRGKVAHLDERGQWARKDSNLRRQSHQIYSLTRLTTSVHARVCDRWLGRAAKYTLDEGGLARSRCPWKFSHFEELERFEPAVCIHAGLNVALDQRSRSCGAWGTVLRIIALSCLSSFRHFEGKSANTYFTAS